MGKDSIKRRRRRSCVDRVRRDLKEQLLRRGRDPAMSAILQLLTVVSIGLAWLPPLPRLSMPVQGFPIGNNFRRRGHSHDPNVDEDRGPTAYAMERGLDAGYYRTAAASRAAPSWSRLVKDLQRKPAKAKARLLIQKRIPPAAAEWLHLQIETEDWIALRRIAPVGATEDEIAANALVEATRWNASMGKGGTTHPGPTPDSDNADDQTSHIPRP